MDMKLSMLRVSKGGVVHLEAQLTGELANHLISGTVCGRSAPILYPTIEEATCKQCLKLRATVAPELSPAHDAPIPTVDDVAAMTGDPVAWLAGLAAPVAECTVSVCDAPLSQHCRQCPTCPVEGLACACTAEDSHGAPVAWLLVVREAGDAPESLGFTTEAQMRCALRLAGVPRTAVYPGRSGICVDAYPGRAVTVSWHRADTPDPVTQDEGLVSLADAAPYRVMGHGDRAYRLVGVSPDGIATLRPVTGGMEWAYDLVDVYRVDGVPMFTPHEVSALMTPEEAVRALRAHVRPRAWSAPRKASRRRVHRKAR